jgi:hypothetical protein
MRTKAMFMNLWTIETKKAGKWYLYHVCYSFDDAYERMKRLISYGMHPGHVRII